MGSPALGNEFPFGQQVVNGLTLGCLYALIALGYTMVYGVLKFINFAHGEICMVGAYLGYGAMGLAMVAAPGLPLPVMLPAVFLAVMGGTYALGSLIERFAYRPLRRAPRLAPLITAIGISLLLQNLVMLVAGKDYKGYPDWFQGGGFTLGSVTVSSVKVMIIASALGLMVALQIFITRTRIGAALRATSMDPLAASLMGIPVNRMINLTFGIGSALGGAAGILMGFNYSLIDFSMGYGTGLKAFTAAVLGGIGSVPGAMAGGLLLGVLEAFGGAVNSQYQNAIAFLVLIAVLIVRPSGLFGEKTGDRV